MKKSIPIEQWGKDHWSTFAYFETRIVDYKGKIDKEHMRCDPDIHPAHINSANLHSKEKYPTRLGGYWKKEGKVDRSRLVKSHDDWSCMEDMEVAGLIKNIGTGLYPVVKLTSLGRQIAGKLREYKANGGQFANFTDCLLSA